MSERLFTLKQTEFWDAGLLQCIHWIQKLVSQIGGKFLETTFPQFDLELQLLFAEMQKREEPNPAGFSKVSRKNSETLRCPCQDIWNQSPASVFISAKCIYLGKNLHAAS